MLENIRKYSALMIIVVALLVFGLVFTLGQGGGSSSTNKEDVVQVNSSGLSNKDFQLLSRDPGLFSQVVPNGRVFFNTASTDLRVIGYPKTNQEFAPAITHLLVQEEAKKLGIFVSTEDAEKFILTELFSDGEGGTDYTRYNQFEEETLKQVNMTAATFRMFIAHLLTIQKVKDIKNHTNVPFDFIIKENNLSNQTVAGTIVQLNIEKFKGTITPSEEQIKAFYEENKNDLILGNSTFRTPRKLKLSYIPVNLLPLPKLDKTNADLIADQKLVQEKTYANYRAFANDEDNFGVTPDIKALAKKHGLTILQTELVSSKELLNSIEDLALTGDQAANGSVHDYLFSGKAKKCTKLQVVVQGAHRASFIHYLIEDTEEPRLKSYEESKEDAKKLVTEKLEREAMVKAAEQARNKIAEAQTAGENIADLIKELKLTSFKERNLKADTSTVDLELVDKLVNEASKLAPSTTSTVVSSDEFASFIAVEKREIEKPANYALLEKVQSRKISEHFATSGMDFTTDIGLLQSIGQGDFFQNRDLGYHEWLLNTKAKATIKIPSEDAK